MTTTPNKADVEILAKIANKDRELLIWWFENMKRRTAITIEQSLAAMQAARLDTIERLRQWMQHKEGCAKVSLFSYISTQECECDCGLTDKLKELKGE